MRKSFHKTTWSLNRQLKFDKYVLNIIKKTTIKIDQIYDPSKEKDTL